MRVHVPTVDVFEIYLREVETWQFCEKLTFDLSWLGKILT